MKLCPKCNAEIEVSSQICSSCGTDISLESEPTRISDDRRREPTEIMPKGNETQPSGGFTPGTVLAGRYRLIMSIGKGGMGEVYKADDLELGQAVAIKFLPPAVAKDEAALKRFRSEVRTARQVAHPNVCRVFDIAEANGVYFITMEYVDGDDLSGLLRRIGRLPSDKAIETSRQLCLGLHAIHDAGILHRDLKPANIIIDSKGKARITDFGIAGVEADLTRDDFRSGTPAYMSPEQLDGDGVTQKSDIYSLGLLLYEIFTGKQAIQFESLPELLIKRQTTTPTNPSEILKDIDPIVERTILQCLEKDPDERPKNALQVALMLPGGNPLEAAIAAGETPSPAMVAAAPKKGTLSLRIATLCLAVLVLALAFNAFIEYKYWVIPTDEKSSELLAARSRTIAANLGYPDKPTYIRYGFAFDAFFIDRLLAGDEMVMNSWEMMKSGQPSPRMFRYRESPKPIVPWAGPQVTVQDPVMEVPGELRILTDPVGRLVEFKVIPELQGSADQTRSVDWGLLFIEAGLDISKYTLVQPDFVPPVFADAKAKWTGPFLSDPSLTVEIKAAAYNGRPVWIDVSMPWAASVTQSVREIMEPPIFIQVLVLVLVTLISLGVVIVSWHNFRSGRGDFRGSLRVMLVILLVSLASGLLLADHVLSLVGEMWVLLVITRNSIFISALGGLMYSALEPQLRRVWPELLISWSRLVAGDARDPMVGRDILMGAICAGIAYSLSSTAFLIPHWLLNAPVPPITHAFRWDGFLPGLANSLSYVPWAIAMTLAITFVVLIVLFITRRRWIAAAALLGIYILISFGGAPGDFPLWIDLLAAVTVAVLITASLVRFGILGLAVFQLFFVTLANSPFIFTPASIYFEVSVAQLMVMLGVIGYGFVVSLGGAKLDLGRLLEGSEPK
ncbi:MAG TPA: protein kinase [Pyrinomonadaceae bacterium]